MKTSVNFSKSWTHIEEEPIAIFSMSDCIEVKIVDFSFSQICFTFSIVELILLAFWNNIIAKSN